MRARAAYLEVGNSGDFAGQPVKVGNKDYRSALSAFGESFEQLRARSCAGGRFDLCLLEDQLSASYMQAYSLALRIKAHPLAIWRSVETL